MALSRAWILTNVLLTTTAAFLLVVYATRLRLTLSFASASISGQQQKPSWLHVDVATSTARGVSTSMATSSVHLACPVSLGLGTVVAAVNFQSPRP
jgi:hypothetical protein